MTRIHRSVAGLGAVALLTLSLGGCGGGDDGGPAKETADETMAVASTKDFCTAWRDTLAALIDLNPEGLTQPKWKTFQAALDDLVDTGLPDDAPPDAVKGHEVFTTALGTLDFKEMKRLQGSDNLPGVSDKDETMSRVFTTYASETCASVRPEE